jgi:hypothetical protein
MFLYNELEIFFEMNAISVLINGKLHSLWLLWLIAFSAFTCILLEQLLFYMIIFCLYSFLYVIICEVFST